MKQVSPYPIRRLRVFSACLLSLLMLLAPMAPMAASVNRIASANAEKRAARKLAQGMKERLTQQEALERSLFVNPPAPVAPNITATLSDSFIDTNPQDFRADPGSVVTYTAVISNSGSDATGVSFSDTIDPNTTLVGGSLKISPLAFPKSFNVKQNSQLNASAPGALTNDTGMPAPTVGGIVGCADVTAPFACGTSASGTVTVNSDGSFTYNPPSAAFIGADTFTYTATNGQLPNDTATVTLNVAPNQAPVLANIEPGALSYSNGSPGVAITGTLTVNDADDANLQSATISITNNFVTGEDLLEFTNQNGITGNYVAATGILTLTGTSSVANYQLALRSVTYRNSAGTVTQSVRTVSFVANDGTANSNAQTRDINVINDTPPTAVSDSPTVNEDVSATAIDVLTNDTDPDGGPKNIEFITQPTNGTVAITGGGTGLTYQPNANYCNNPPGAPLDTFTYTLNGGSIGTVTMTVTCVNDPPSFTKGADQTVDEDSGAQTVNGWATAISAGPPDESGQTLTFVVTNNTNAALFSAGPAVASDGTLTYTPAANANGSATITLKLTDNGGGTNESATQSFVINVTAINDAPSFTKGADQTVNEDSGAQTVPAWATGISAGPANESGQTLTFVVTNNTNSGLFTAGPSVAANGTLTYTPAANANGSATITLKITDDGGTAGGGVNESPTQTFVINVTAVNDPPSFTKGADQNVNEDAGAQTVPGWAAAISAGPADESAQTLTFVITNNTNAGLFSAGPSVAANGTLTYTPTANANGSATITLKLQDNGGGTNESGTQTFVITVGAVNDPPSFTKGADQTVNEDVGAQTVAGWATAISAGPADEAGQTLTFVITNNTNSALFSAGPSVASNGTLTYTPAANANGTAAITLKLTDSGGGTNESPTQTFNINVTAVNDAPVLTASGGSASFTEDGPAVAVDPGITVADIDSLTLASGTVQITGNNQSGEDVLAFTNDGSTMGNIAAAAYVPATGLLTLTSAGGTATLAEWQSALRSVTYNNTSQNPNTTARTVSFKVNDGAANSNIPTRGVTVTAVNDAPVLANSGAGLNYTENGLAAVINNAITVTDVDSANITGATVSITANLQANKDVLSFANTVNITGSYDGTTGILTLSGTDTKANYETALRNVKYSSTSEDPSTLARTVSFRVNDGGAVNNLSNIITSTVNVTAVNDPPTAAAFAGLPAQAGIPITYPAGKLSGTDNAEEAANLTVVTIATIPDSVTNGTVAINGNGDGGFTFTPNSNGLAASFTYHVNDNGKPGAGVSSAPATVSFTVAGPPLYFVKSAAVGSGNCTLLNECTLATAISKMNTDNAGGAVANAVAFISDANTQSPGTITLGAAGQSIVGQGVVAASFDSLFGIGAPAQGTLAARPNVNQTRPTINGAATITAHNSTSLRGFNYTPSGNGLVAVARTNLVVSDMNITSTSNTAGQFAVNFSSNTTGTFTWGDIIISGANVGSGVNFNTTTSGSTVTFNNITTAGGAAFTSTSTGATNFTFNDVTSTTGTAVSVATATGAFTFHAINKNGGSIGVDVSSATGSFTVNGTSTTAGTGGTIQNTTSHGVKFASSNNITLKNMNLTNDAQTQTVAGNSPSCGGDLHSGNNLSCVAGVFLSTVTNVTLTNLSVTGSNQMGINGNNITHFTLTNSTVTGNGNEAFESGVVIQNLLGTGGNSNLIQDSNIRDNAARQIHIDSASGSTQLDVKKNTGTMYIGNTSRPSNGTSQQGLLVDVNNAFTLNVDQVTVKNNVNNGVDVLGRSGAVINGHVNNSVFDINGAGIDVQTISTSGTPSAFDITNNSQITGNLQSGIHVATGAGATSTLLSKITGNTIGIFNSNLAVSACDPGAATPQYNCNGIEAHEFGGTVKATITGNSIHQVGGTSIFTVSNAGTHAVTISGNTIDQPGNVPGAGGNAAGYAIDIDVGSLSAVTECVNIVSNTFSSADFNGTAFGWAANQAQTAIHLLTKNSSVTSIPNLSGPGGTTTSAVATYISTHQTSAAAAATTNVQSASSGTYAVGGANCGTPLLLAQGGVESELDALFVWSHARSAGAAKQGCAARLNDFSFLTDASAYDVRDAGRSDFGPASTVTASLTQSQLDSIVSAALERWTSAGLTQPQIATLRAINFDVADLGGEYLGESSGQHVLIDRNAGGKGWFTGVDSSSDSLFSRAVSNTRRYTDPKSAPAGHLDLLTAIEHEMGHKLGLGDSYAAKDRDNLMYGYLTAGERRLPAQGQAKSATISNSQGTQHLSLRSGASTESRRAATPARRSVKPVTPLSGETVTANIGTLRAGKTDLTITFQVTLNAGAPSQVSTQGKVFYDSGPAPIFNSDGANPGLGTNATVFILTDDLKVGTNAPGETDPTVTSVDTPTASDSSVSGQIVDSNGNPVEGAAIHMTGTQDRLTVTDAAGNYHFDNVETNGFYTVVPARANFSFSPSQRAFSQLGQHTDAIFSATPNGGTANPLDTTEYFVRQQYVDFLNREPDESGLGFWVNNIESCGNDANCRAVKRTDTSAAFFLSVEFQQTGYLVYRTYQAAFGDLADASIPIKLGEFKPDAAEIGNGVIVNQSGWETVLENNKQAYAAEFIQRPRFTAAYPSTMTPAEFVDRLFTNAGVRAGDTDRAAAISEFGSATTSADVRARGRALRRVAENTTLAQQEFTQAFVLMEYFGYLRRDVNSRPDSDFSGYNFWLDKLNAFGGNYQNAEMVKAFLLSGEYRGRFPR
jgi:hypothetical protein